MEERVSSVRCCQRKKDREADRISRVEQDLADLKNLMQEIKQRPPSSTHPQADDPALDLSQRRSSVDSTEVRADDQALLDYAPAPRYPMDDVIEMAQCELHQPMNNLSFKVAINTALPCLRGALLHSLPIPPGYARVTSGGFCSPRD